MKDEILSKIKDEVSSGVVTYSEYYDRMIKSTQLAKQKEILEKLRTSALEKD